MSTCTDRAKLVVGRQYTHRVKQAVHFDGAKWTYAINDRPVTFMASYGIWAMVRRKGFAPYVCRVKELR